jgi:hypothetical protein
MSLKGEDSIKKYRRFKKFVTGDNVMRREEITEFKIQKLLKDRDIYDFPIFLSMLRKIHGAKRSVVSEDVGISLSKLFQLEKGKFDKYPSELDIKVLSHYYGVPHEVLREKSNKFLNLKKPKKQRKESHA